MPGLCQRITKATSVKELNELVQEGRSYQLASVKTVRRWERLAKKKEKELTTPKASK